jgi:peptide/nickel transport system substrate-binding protein
MKQWKTILAAAALALASGTAAMAARTDLVLGMPLEPPHLDPTAGAAAAIDEVFYANVFEGLTRIGSRGEVLPDLAESWTISDDGKTYTFKLRSGVKFHDGSDFDASDVKFSLDRARGESSVNAQKGLFAPIDTIEVVDPATVKVTLKNPQGSFLYNLGWGDAVIVAPESAETNKEKPVGTGPFKFQNWAKGSSITLVKADGYWGEPVALDKAEFRIIPDAAAAIPALLSGDVQALPNFALGDALPRSRPTRASRWSSAPPRAKRCCRPTTRSRPSTISRCARRSHMPSTARRSSTARPVASARRSARISPRHNPAYVDLTGTYPHDIAKAKELLKEAGPRRWLQGDAQAAAGRICPPGGEIIASQLREIGIDLQIIPVEWADWLKQVFTDKDYDLSIVSHTEPNDIDIYARKDYYFNYDNPAFNKVIDELNLTSDEAKRTELYKQAQKILADDAVNGFLFELPKVGIWDAKVEGLWENSPIQANDLTKVKWVD